jgi:MSHA biogenesis protein MshP
MKISSQHGFTLVQAVFIIVVLGLLGAMMVRLIGVQSSTTTFALQGARAYQAARSGLEWGAARASAGDSCNGAMVIGNFNVVVACNNALFTEGPISPYNVFRITAFADNGIYRTPDYVSRRAEMKMVRLP